MEQKDEKNLRVAAFDLTGFPKGSKPPITAEIKAIIDQVSEDNDFTGRNIETIIEPVKANIEPARQQRRHRTGRNQQLNIKATDQTVQKFYRIADEANITLGEVLERALSALEASNAKVNQ